MQVCSWSRRVVRTLHSYPNVSKPASDGADTTFCLLRLWPELASKVSERWAKVRAEALVVGARAAAGIGVGTGGRR